MRDVIFVYLTVARGGPKGEGVCGFVFGMPEGGWHYVGRVWSPTAP